MEWYLWKWRSFLQKKNVLEKDYERYFFPIPVNKVFGKGRNRFIFSELEKRHPCFSDEYCFDVDLKVQNRNLISDVIVIKKKTLAEYLQDYGNGLYFSDCKKKRFRNKGNKYIFFILSVLIITGIFLLSANKKTEIEIAEVDMEPSIDLIPESTAIQERKYQDLLRVVKEEQGKITCFNWKTDGINSTCKVFIESVFPEKIKNAWREGELSSITYSDGIPSYSFTVMEKVLSVNDFDIHNSQLNISEKLRTFVLNQKLNLQEEMIFPYSIKFEGKVDKDFFEKLTTILKENDCFISGFTLDFRNALNTSDASVEISLGQETGFEKGFNSECVCEYFEVFGQREKKQYKTVVTKQSSNKGRIPENYTKIGEVRYENGTKMIFYKNEMGKLIKKLEKIDEK